MRLRSRPSVPHPRQGIRRGTTRVPAELRADVRSTAPRIVAEGRAAQPTIHETTLGPHHRATRRDDAALAGRPDRARRGLRAAAPPPGSALPVDEGKADRIHVAERRCPRRSSRRRRRRSTPPCRRRRRRRPRRTGLVCTWGSFRRGPVDWWITTILHFTMLIVQGCDAPESARPSRPSPAGARQHSARGTRRQAPWPFGSRCFLTIPRRTAASRSDEHVASSLTAALIRCHGGPRALAWTAVGWSLGMYRACTWENSIPQAGPHGVMQASRGIAAPHGTRW